MKVWFVPNTPMKILLEPHYYEYEGETIKIEAWYAFDGLSIPRPFQWVVNMKSTKNIKAWLEHDHLYSKLMEGKSSRKGSDIHLKKWVEAGFIRSRMVYRGVRMFWWGSYRKDSNYVTYQERIVAYRKYLWLKKSIS